MATSKAGLNSQAYAELQEAVASLQAQIDNLGGGALVTTFYSGMIFTNPIGKATINIPAPPAGQRVVLEALATNNLSVVEVSVVGSISGSVINSKELSSAVSSGNGRFAVGANVQSNELSSAGVITKLIFEKDETVSITKGPTSDWVGTLFYSYSYAKDA